MDAGAIVSCLLCLISAIAITPLVLLLNSFLVSILPVKRNLFTYLDQFFIRVALFDVYAGVCTRANILKFSFYIWSEFCGDCEATLGSRISDLGLNLLRHHHLVFVLHWRDPPSCQPSAGLSCCDGKVPTNDICSFVQVYLHNLNFMTNSLVFIFTCISAGHLQQPEARACGNDNGVWPPDLQHSSSCHQRL